ncbi:MAG: hypothetical protein KGL52_14015 [Rhodospirillales bacterium]|nr:hypothetical protein [Rhodospirillales bacterium]
MLRKARAPDPWQSPNACEQAAAAVNAAMGLMEHYRTHPIGRTAVDRACDAVDELRRVLPKVIAEASLPMPPGFGFPAGIDDSHFHEARSYYLTKLLHLEAALFDIWPRTPSKWRTPENDWRGRACLLFRWYAVIVRPDPPITRNGPAVRFVVAGLGRIGEGQRTPDTVEKALQRIARGEAG